MKADKLQVNIYQTRAQMGAAAAQDIKSKFCEHSTSYRRAVHKYRY